MEIQAAILIGSTVGSLNCSAGKAVMSTPAPPPNCLATLSNSAASSASVAGVLSTMPPPAAAFFAAYSWIFDRNKPWIGSVDAAAAIAGVLLLKQRLAIEIDAARRDIMVKLGVGFSCRSESSNKSL